MTAAPVPATASQTRISAPQVRQDALGEILRASVQQRSVRVAPVVQRAVRVAGKRKVDEGKYLPGGTHEKVGTKRSVATLINDDVQRVFRDEDELISYANDATDYIGDVKTADKQTFWYRLPRDNLTVLGEEHCHPGGNVRDVLVAFGTSRFMYEPFSAIVPVNKLNIEYANTSARLKQIDKDLKEGLTIDPARDPALENLVLKALVGITFMREFARATPPEREQAQWKGPEVGGYSTGERCALYFALAVRLAQDIAKTPVPKDDDWPLYSRARQLKDIYNTRQDLLRSFRKKKEKHARIGVYEITAANKFKDLLKLDEFAQAFLFYAAQYLRQLGIEQRSKVLQHEGTQVASDPSMTFDALNAAREEIMWQRVRQARDSRYLLVGMGDAHRKHLTPRLDEAGIAHARVDEDLVAQQQANGAQWRRK